MKNFWLTIGLSVVLIVSTGCNFASNLIGGESEPVANLWSDVPALQGAQRADIGLPLPMRLAIQGFMKASAQNTKVQLENFDFVAYTTPMKPQEVTDFYSQERMQAAGWNAEDVGGCTGAASTAGLSGGLCAFGKDVSGQQSMLIVLTGQDDKANLTQVFYVRFDGQFKFKG